MTAEDYRLSHQPDEDAPPLYDLTPQWGEDIYTHPEWFGLGRADYDRPAVRVIRAARGHPDLQVTIYRAVPDGVTTINTGDWVTTVEAYARQHAVVNDDPKDDWPVYSASVPASTVRNGGSDLLEWGYWGPQISAVALPRRNQPPIVKKGGDI